MSDEFQQKLSVVRAEYDAIDAKLLELLSRRARCAQQVGEIKASHGDAGHIYRPEREAQVLRRIQSLNPGPLSNESVTYFPPERRRHVCRWKRRLASLSSGHWAPSREPQRSSTSAMPPD